MTEKDEAVLLAERVLDKPYIDPDGDICLLARQFLRASELIAKEKAAYAALWKDRDEQEHLRAAYFREIQALRERVAQLEKQIQDLRSRLGKPRCLDCNAAGITNCSHFDNCAGTWKYELEERAEAAEKQVEGLRAALREAQNRIWEHHEIGHIRRAYEDGLSGSCDLCGDGIFKRIEAALATQLPTED